MTASVAESAGVNLLLKRLFLSTLLLLGLAAETQAAEPDADPQ